MDLVDEEQRVVALAQRVHVGLEARLEVAAVAGAREHRADVERVELGVAQVVGHAPLADPQREALGERRLADARLADEDRVVLPAPREDVHDPVELGAAPDQRIELALAPRAR